MSRRKRVLAWGVWILVVVLCGWLAHALSMYRGYSGSHVVMVIPQGASARGVADALHEVGVIRSRLVFTLLLELSGSTSQLHAGEYRFHEPMTPLDVRRRLVQGAVLLHPITVPEGLRAEQVFELFVGRGVGTAQGFREAFEDVTILEGVDGEARNLEGYLYPDTYVLPRTLSEREILHAMVRRFRKEFGSRERQQARSRGLSTRQVVTLASMIERETHLGEERALVSSVFHNRLKKGMLMQCDPTVIYALILEGDYKGRLTRKGLRVDSPYNTYRYRGLPPGPIANPGKAALKAALRPAESDYLYFVATKEGNHQFSKSLAEHRRAVDRYQRR